jgi:zinc/manganese transport system ATP-binding protein
VSEPAVAFANVAFDRGERRILNRVSFTVAPGEFIGIIGGNGAGKSTLLHLMLGILAPTEGEVRVFGAAPGTTHGAIGYVPQRIELDPDLPLRASDFVGLGIDGARFGLPFPSAGKRARVDEVLAEVDVTSLAGKPVGRLSGGEQQRLAIAQAIVGRPKLLLLDEPLANLDLRSAAEVVALVARLGRERGMTVLLVAHDVNPIVRVMDRVLYLAGGRAALGKVDEIVNEDTLSRLYDRPVDVLRVRGRIIVVAGDELV